MEENKKLQVEMHKDFFDRCKFAIENKFYMEAIIGYFFGCGGVVMCVAGMGLFSLNTGKT